jgi:hypothetical protein
MVLELLRYCQQQRLLSYQNLPSLDISGGDQAPPSAGQLLQLHRKRPGLHLRHSSKLGKT